MTAVIHVLVVAAAALAASDAPPPATREGAPQPCPAVEGSEAQGEGRWIESSHDTVERGINALVLRLDRFFGEPANDPYEPPTSHIRFRNEVRTGEDDLLQAGTSVSGNLRLPTADRALSRFSLLITGETEPRPGPGPDVDRSPPRFDARVQAADGGLELRYDIYRGKHTLLDAGAGARLGWPPPPFTRVRLAQGFPLGVKIAGRVSQSVFWDRSEGFGETTRLDVERTFLENKSFIRWGSIGTVDEVSRGYEWASEAGLGSALGPRTGVYLAAGIDGATRSAADIGRYRVYTRVRRDVYRGWAFIEVEPEVAWPADEFTGERSRVRGVTLRLEIQFSSGAQRPTPLCTPLPEPDPLHPRHVGGA